MTRRSRALLSAVVLSLIAAGHPSRSLAQSAFSGPRIVGSDPGGSPGGAVTRLLALGRDAVVLWCGAVTPPLAASASIGMLGPEIAGVRSVSGLAFWPHAGRDDDDGGRRWAAIDGRVLVQRITFDGGGEPWLLDPASGAWSSAGQTIAGPLGGEPRLMTLTDPLEGGLSGPTRRVYFVARDDTLRERVWRSDGMPAGLSAVTPCGSAWTLAPLAAGMVALGYEFDADGARLWRLDTPDEALGSWPRGYPGGLVRTSWGAELAVSGPDATTLYRTDGTPAGTVALGSIPGRAELLAIAGAAEDEPRAARLCRGRTPAGLQELWSLTHGAGAARLAGGFESIDTFAAARDLAGRTRLVFAATGAGESSARLWVSDGSPDASGTRPLAAPGVSGLARPRVWCSDRGLVYFTASEPTSGLELWRTDGTPAGTRRLTDLRQGPEDSSPRLATVVNSRLYFAATDAQGVDAVWSLDLCPADFDNGGEVGVQDLFDYLVAYFGLNMRADVNANALVSVQDVFDFLGVFLGGCGP